MSFACRMTFSHNLNETSTVNRQKLKKSSQKRQILVNVSVYEKILLILPVLELIFFLNNDEFS